MSTKIGVAGRPFEVVVPLDADERVVAGAADQGVRSAGAADELDRGRQVRGGLDDVGRAPRVIDDPVAGCERTGGRAVGRDRDQPSACRIENDGVVRGRWADDDLVRWPARSRRPGR